MLREMKRLFIVALMMGTALTASAQSSQKLRDRDPDLEGSKKLATEMQQANFHSGSFYLLSRFRISDAGFTEGASLPTGNQSSGLSLSVEAPQRLYYVPHRKTVFTLELTPGYSFFNALNEERKSQFNYLGRGDAHFLFNHLYLDIYALRENALQGQVADINRLATVRTDETGVAGEFKYSSKTSALFTARARDIAFPSDRFQPQDIPVDLLDRTERNGRLSLHHKTFPLTALFVAGERSDYTFDRRGLFTSRDSTRTWVGGGVSYNSGRASLRVEAGPLKLDFDDPTQRDYKGIAASLLGVRSTSRNTWRLGADRDLGFSVAFGNNYFVSTSYHASVSHSSTRRLSLRAGSVLERDDYDVPIAGLRRRDTISFSSVGFTYALRRVSLGADVGWYERDSTVGGDEDSGIRTLLHLSFTP
jgi:hypothetical protein